MKTKYFKDLNYTLSNEDTRIERQLLADLPEVLVVGGSGARVLPLMKSTVHKLQVVDISENQLKLTRLRCKAAEVLCLEDFKALLGYTPSLKRQEIFMSLPLPRSDQHFWMQSEKHWSPQGFIFLGRWENHLRQLGVLFRKIFSVDFADLFEMDSVDQRRQWMEMHWPGKRLQIFLQICANPWVFNLLLYRGHFVRSQESVPLFLMQVFENGLIERNPRESFFLQMLFLGDLRYSEGHPLEVDPEVYKETQKFKGEIRFTQTDLLSYLQSHSADFVSLSDVPSYFNQEQIQQLQKCLLRDLEQRGGAWVIRSFLRHPPWESALHPFQALGKNRWAEESDTTGVYKFHIFETLKV